MTTKECLNLYDSFKRNEKQTELLGEFSEGAFPCIRLDGFKHSSGFLKDCLINVTYARAAHDSIMALHRCTRKLFDNTYPENWLLACSFSDEVSIVLGPSLTNWKLGRRMMKICTVLAGDMSSYFTSYVRKRHKKLFADEARNRDHPAWTPLLAAYDARPLQLCSPHEIAQYVRHRYLVACRYAYWKVLRLNGECYEDDVKKKDLDFLREQVRSRGLMADYEKVISGFTIYYPDGQGKLYVKRNVSEDEMTVEALTQVAEVLIDQLEYMGM